MAWCRVVASLIILTAAAPARAQSDIDALQRQLDQAKAKAEQAQRAARRVRTAPPSAAPVSSEPALLARPIPLVPVLISSDAPCTLSINGKRQPGVLAITRVRYYEPPGETVMDCVSTEEPDASASSKVMLQDGQGTSVELALNSRISALRKAHGPAVSAPTPASAPKLAVPPIASVAPATTSTLPVTSVTPVSEPLPAPPKMRREVQSVPTPLTTAVATGSSLKDAVWEKARNDLAHLGSSASFAEGLQALLGTSSDEESDAYQAFQEEMENMQWKSALAIGQSGGLIKLGFRWGRSRDIDARDESTGICASTAEGNCYVVMADGKFNIDALRQLATKLGQKEQLATREVFLDLLQRISQRTDLRTNVLGPRHGKK